MTVNRNDMLYTEDGKSDFLHGYQKEEKVSNIAETADRTKHMERVRN